MSQHDMILDNASGASVRSDLNSALQALASTSKGASASSTPYAGQRWIDDDTPSSSKWSENIYDGADSIKIAEIDATNNLYVGQVGGGVAQTIASATTTNLGSVFEANIVISGTTTITGFGSSAPRGAIKFVSFSGSLALTHNATSLILPGGANITTAAGDTLIAEPLGSGNWRVLAYQKANGAAVTGGQFSMNSFTRDMTTASGSQAVTGVGFKPKAILFWSTVANTAGVMSTGLAVDGSTPRSLWDNHNVTANNYGASNTAITLQTSSGNVQTATIASYDADGFTLTRTKTGSPTGTETTNYLCIR